VLFPACYLGKFPDRKIMEASHTASLAMDFGRDVRNMVNSPEYQRIFPGVALSQDARAAHRWNTNKGGQFFAVGCSGAAAGRGGDLVMIDDPHSEQDVLNNSKAEFEKIWKWYMSGPRQRLQPGAAILVTMTRWGELDLTGKLQQMAIEEGEQWQLLELPAILPPSGENPEEHSLWPAYWPLRELQRTRSTLPAARWQAQYQQRPVAEEGAIIKREWWHNWTSDTPPPLEVLVTSWDTAFSEKDSANRSAMITWGKFSYRTPENKLEQGII
jgi:hypothetical protein